MKQKLIALLKTLFASKGFNAKELEGLADIVIAQNTLTDDSTDEDLSTAAEAAKPTADFVQSVASRQVTDVKKPKVDPKPTDTPPAAPDVDPNETQTEKMLRQALEGITVLTAKVTAMEGEKIGTTRREQFIKSMEGTSPEYQARELKRFDRITFKDDEDFNGFLEDTKEDHAAAKQEEANETLGGGRPAGGSGKPLTGEKEVSPAMKELIADREAKAKAAAQTN